MENNSHYLNALLRGDSDQINDIYQENFPKIRAFICKNNGHEADAEDIFQKALVQLVVRYRKEKFVITSSFEAYLFTACKNLWRRELNKRKNQVTIDEFIEPMNEAQDLAMATLEQKRWELFKEVLESISENCKKVLTLFFAKVTYKNIVDEMQYNSETVARQRVFKCKAKLTELIQKDQRYNSLKEL